MSGRALRREKKKEKITERFKRGRVVCVCDRDISCAASYHIAVTAAFFSSFCTLTYPVVYYVVVDHSAYFLTSAQTHTTELKLWLIVLCVL